MSRKSCDKIALFPQFPGQPTCWFNAIVTMAIFSQYSRNMIIANRDKWARMPPRTRAVFEKLVHEKSRSDDHDFFKDVHPVSLLKHLHEANPKQFYIRTIENEGGSDTYYLPRFYNFLGAQKFIRFDAVRNRNGTVNLYIDNRSTYYNWVQTAKNLHLKVEKMQRKTFRNVPDEEFDYITITFHETNANWYSRKAPALKNIPYSSFFSNRGFVLKNNNYILDCMYWGNSNHAIAGITCDNEKYVYNGYTKTGKTVPLFKYDWANETQQLALSIKEDPDIGKGFSLRPLDKNNDLHFKFEEQNQRTYVFVNEKYTTRNVTQVRSSHRPTNATRFPSGGNCLFDSLGKFIGETGSALRVKIADFLEHWGPVLQIGTGLTLSEIALATVPGMTLDEYLTHIRGDGWGGLPEIITFVEMTGHTAIVVDSIHNETYTPNNRAPSGCEIMIRYENNNHWVAVTSNNCTPVPLVRPPVRPPKRPPVTPLVRPRPVRPPVRPPKRPPVRPRPVRPPVRPRPVRPVRPPNRPSIVPKKCPPGKIINPRTNRCVNIDGKIGKQVLAQRR